MTTMLAVQKNLCEPLVNHILFFFPIHAYKSASVPELYQSLRLAFAGTGGNIFLPDVHEASHTLSFTLIIGDE